MTKTSDKKSEKYADLNFANSSFSSVYDELPYDNYPHEFTNPQKVGAIAQLFGMSPVALENARVLELGCAAGGNLIPHAVNYPKAHFVGVDLSKIQINEANRIKEDLGLENTKFLQASIADIDDSFGKFDYIICHGVMSWVSQDIQDKILEICSKNLNANGVAYISYNTLPGWNMVRTVGDMMRYHSNSFPTALEKATQGKLFVEFVRDVLEDSNSPYAQMLRSETESLSKKSVQYLHHEYLGKDNMQFYFHDFIAMAQKYDLQYLAECNINAMYLGNMPQKAIEKLGVINDIIRVEQYMDFIMNRRFRATLLCHKDVKLNRTIKKEDIEKFNIYSNFTPERPLKEVDLNNSTEILKFFVNNNAEVYVSASSAYMKAIMYSFCDYKTGITNINQLVAEAAKKLQSDKQDEIKNEFENYAMQLLLQGVLQITLQEPFGKPNTQNPKMAQLAMHQATKSPDMWVTNLNHKPVPINSFEKFAIRYMDGKHNKKAIIDKIMENIVNGDITLHKDEKKLENEKDLRKELENLLNAAIQKFSNNALLV